MLKSFFKEVLIIVVLVLIIIGLLAVLFYDYIPSSKIVPAKVEAYALSEDVNEELQKDLANKNSDEIVKTYQIDVVELEHYEKIKEYNKGKVNPFLEYNSGTSNNNNNSNSNSGTSNNNNNSNNNSGTSTGNGQTNNNQKNTNTQNSNSSNSSDNSQGTFLKTVGK